MSRRSLAVAALSAAGITLFPAAAPAASKNQEFGARVLKQGAKGRDVRVLQDFLSRAGVGTPVDGRFGPATRRKVREWERTHAPKTRVDGRLTRRESRLLRQDVERAETSQAPPPAPPSGEKATIGSDGLAVAPASAPEAVKRMIAAANEIHDKPYRYGGGHKPRPNKDSGYDCSGSMSFAMQGAGLLDEALDSSGFARYGESGKGDWVTIYGNAGHSFMVIAGLRFDTSGRKNAGSRWQTKQRSDDGYAVRHPKGL